MSGPDPFDLNQPPAEFAGGEPWLSALAAGGTYGPTDEDKKWYKGMADDAGLISDWAADVGAVGCVAWETEVGLVLCAAGIAFHFVWSGAAWSWEETAADPPRPDYKHVVRVRADQIKLPNQTPEPIANIVRTGETLFHLSQGMLVSVESCQGAFVAKDELWALIHASTAQGCWEGIRVLLPDVPQQLRAVAGWASNQSWDQPIKDADWKKNRAATLNAAKSPRIQEMGLDEEDLKRALSRLPPSLPQPFSSSKPSDIMRGYADRFAKSIARVTAP